MVFLTLYRWLIIVLAPLVRRHVLARARKGKEDPARLAERWGIASAPNDGKRYIWVHAASVGEALTALSVIDRIQKQASHIPVILTTGTVTSARMIAGRLPHGVIHQYAPYDHPSWIGRFLDYWHPIAAVRIEAEIWPTTLQALKQRAIPVALLNAHMSDTSYRRWRYARGAARILMSTFTAILADGVDNADRYRDLGARDVTVTANIKFITAPLPVNAADIDTLRTALGDRPVWLYASTHADEELIAANIHRDLRRTIPNLLTLIAPRHPARVPGIVALITQMGLKIAQRSITPLPAPQTDIYIIDTMGELGTFYSLVPMAVIGRSFSRDGGGGHNPIEPALLSCYPLSGPNVHNVQTIFDAMMTVNATETLPDVTALTARVRTGLQDPQGTYVLAQAAAAKVATMGHQVQQSVDVCLMRLLQGVRI